VVKGALVQTKTDEPGEAVYRVKIPYITADVDINLSMEAGSLELSISSDGGESWRSIPELSAHQAANQTLSLSKSGLDSHTGPIGRYDYLLKVKLQDGCRLSALRIDTIFQHNFLVLPLLLPGENTITLTGQLARGYAVEVTYIWDDPRGKGFEHTVCASELPSSFSICAAGRSWKDVRCRRLVVRAVKDDERGHRIVSSPHPAKATEFGPVSWTDVLTLVGPDSAPPPKTTAQYLKDLEEGSWEEQAQALAGLIQLRDPNAWEPLERIALESTDRFKFYAVQALFWTDAERAWPVMKKILERHPDVKWPTLPLDRRSRTPFYDNMAAMTASLCAVGGITEAVPLLCSALGKMKLTEPKWAVLRSLGKFGDARARGTVTRYARSRNVDTSNIALEAAGRLGATEVVPQLKGIVSKPPGYSIRWAIAIEALGKLGAEDCTDLLLPYLDAEDEDFRAAGAEALGRIGDPAKSIPGLQSALEAEPFPFVRQRMQQALELLRERGPR
jgi:HEAT repeat protein